jgi:hypothetical protein
MFSRKLLWSPLVFAIGLACSPASDPDSGQGGAGGSKGGSGGSAGRGGSGGSQSGTGGSGGASGQGGTGGTSASGGTGGGTGGSGGSGGTGGSAGSGGGGSGGSAGAGGSGGSSTDAKGAPDTGGAKEMGGGDLPPSAPGQGPVADGKIVFSNDFEAGMTGVTRSPNGLPEDRVQIVDDPKGQRGKVIRIEYRQGDNFRTSPGTEPRSWISAADGYTIRSNTKISVAWGQMFQSTTGATYSFAQIIRSGGPLWMFHIGAGGTFRISVNRGSGGGNNLLTFQPMTWYDFRVDVDYRGGGSIEFYANGRMVARGTGDGGPSDGRWDGGVYWQSGAKSTRVVYVSNVSIAERP